MVKKKKFLVFGAHPDDYEIGMGGTINKLVNAGHEVKLVLVTIPDKDKKLRLNEAQKAAGILGADFLFLDISSDDMQLSRDLIAIFDKLIHDFSPDEIYTHWIYDSHQDHKTISNCLISSTRKNTCSLMMYTQTIPGGVTPYSFNDQIFVDISDQIETKLNSILAHESQIKKHGLDWVDGVKGRAKLHGYQIKSDYAETFEVVKHIRSFK